MLRNPLREFAKRLGLWIDRALKTSNLILVIIAGIDGNCLGVKDERVPIFGLHQHINLQE